jgi:hypothetical protein
METAILYTLKPQTNQNTIENTSVGIDFHGTRWEHDIEYTVWRCVACASTLEMCTLHALWSGVSSLLRKDQQRDGYETPMVQWPPHKWSERKVDSGTSLLIALFDSFVALLQMVFGEGRVACIGASDQCCYLRLSAESG